MADLSPITYREFVSQAGLPIAQAAVEWRQLKEDRQHDVRQRSHSSQHRISSKKKNHQKKSTPSTRASSKKKSGTVTHVRAPSILSDVVRGLFGIAPGNGQQTGAAAFRKQLDDVGDDFSYSMYEKLLSYALHEGTRLGLSEERITDALAALVQNRSFQRLTKDVMLRDEIDKMLSVVAVMESSETSRGATTRKPTHVEEKQQNGVQEAKKNHVEEEEEKKNHRRFSNMEEKQRVHDVQQSDGSTKKKKAQAKPKKLDVAMLYEFATAEASKAGLQANAISNALDELGFFRADQHRSSYNGDETRAKSDISAWMQKRKLVAMKQ